MGIDRPDDADLPADEPADNSGGAADAPTNDDRQARREQIEPRYHQEYYDQLRATDGRGEESPAEEQPEAGQGSQEGVQSQEGEPSKGDELAENTQQVQTSDLGAVAASEERAPAGESSEPAQSTSAEPAENGDRAQESSWAETAELSRWMWGEYLRRWPPEERASVDRTDDPPGSWRGEGERTLDSDDNARIETECDRIEERAENIITPALRDVESQDPDRCLVGIEHLLKGRDRIKEKVYDNMKEFDCSATEALAIVPDTIRCTFQYEKAHYTEGVYADIARLREQGFEFKALKNAWSSDQYKGLNSQWIEPTTGQRFEVQFHIEISFEAKQLTHDAYGRLRSAQKPDAFEQMVLEAFQRKVTTEVPIPPGAVDIPDYP